MIEKPTIIDVSARLIAVLPITVARDKIRTVMSPGIQELKAILKDQNIAPTGTWFTHHFRRPTDTFDFEIGITVALPVAASGRVGPATMPAMCATRAIYSGAYEGLTPAWGEFLDWIEANGYQRTPDLWEHYLSGPEANPDPTTWRTELIQPLMQT